MSADDDGLLLNFSTAAPVIRTVPAKKPTTEQYQKTAVKKQQPAKRRVVQNDKDTSGSKRQKANNSDKVSMKKIIELEGKEQSKLDIGNEDNSNKKSKNDMIDSNTFVSSLFSSNMSAQSINNGTLQFKKLSASNDPSAQQNSEEIKTFQDLNLNATLANHLTTKLKFLKPTMIQSLVVPQILKQSTVKFSSDLFIQAQTGSGKTLSFALPIINQLMNPDLNINRTSGLFAIVLAPSRELATQIYQVFEQLCQCCVRIVPGIVIGGEKKKSEKARIRKGVNVLVSTPGRLLDHLNSTKNLKEQLGLVRWLVLDEGDRLMELGFEETLSEIIRKLESSAIYNNNNNAPSRAKFFDLLPNRRINVLCSATIKSNVEKLGQISLRKPILISIDVGKENDNNNLTSVPDQLIQQIMVVPPKLRLVSLQALLKLITSSSVKNSEYNSTRTIVFFSCGDSVDFHFDVFTRDGVPVVSIKPEAAPKWNHTKKNNPKEHGPTATGKFEVTVNSAMTAPLVNKNTAVYKLHGTMPQHIRTATLKSFINSTEKNCVLLCTDVASRGLDLPQISHIVEYDPAFSIDDHLHRVGRTARAGRQGSAALFLLPGNEEGYVTELKKYHHSGFKMLNNEEDVLKKAFGELDESSKKWDVLVTTWHLTVERWLLEDSVELSKAEKAFMSHVRAYATHLNAERKYFNIRGLHLGHLAKSFGLRDPPKKLGSKYGSGGRKEDSKKVKKLKQNSKLQMENDNDDMRKQMLKLAELAVQKLQNNEFNFA